MLIGSNLPAIVGLNGEACDIREQIQDCEQRLACGINAADLFRNVRYCKIIQQCPGFS
jgi:hypothetical protein